MSKQKIIGIALVALVLVSLAVLVVAPRQDGFGNASGDAVALVRLSGPIQDSGSSSLLGAAAITPDLVRQRLDAATQSAATKAVVLRVDSPGGTVAASQEIADMVRAAPEPIVVSMGDVAASGGYYISSQADAIVAQPGTLTGSIGVIWSNLDPSGLFRKLGIDIDAVTAGKHKDMLLPGRLTPERRRLLQRLVDTMYAQFVSAVARGRDLSRTEVRALATGEPFTGAQALRNGLVDKLGGLDEAVAEAERIAGIEDAEVVEMSPSLFEQLFSGGGFAGARALFEDNAAVDRLALLRDLLTTVSAPRYGL